MMYALIEIQTNNNVMAVVTPIRTFSDQNLALQAYFNTIAAAVVSNVPLHTVILLNEHGMQLRAEEFKHEIELIEPTESEGE